MLKPNIIVVGPSGSGKSSAVRGLLTAGRKVAVLNAENKALPFPGGSKIENQYTPANFLEVFEHMKEIKARDDIDVVVIESWTTIIEMLEQHSKEKFPGGDGFKRWEFYNDTLERFLKGTKTWGKTMIYLAVEELIDDGEARGLRRAKVRGRQWRGMVEKEFVIALWSQVQRTEDGVRYVFQTQSDGLNAAKSPLGMFDELYIPNDLEYVLQKTEEYDA